MTREPRLRRLGQAASGSWRPCARADALDIHPYWISILPTQATESTVKKGGYVTGVQGIWAYVEPCTFLLPFGFDHV
jgi:hypothetical protein